MTQRNVSLAWAALCVALIAAIGCGGDLSEGAKTAESELLCKRGNPCGTGSDSTCVEDGGTGLLVCSNGDDEHPCNLNQGATCWTLPTDCVEGYACDQDCVTEEGDDLYCGDRSLHELLCGDGFVDGAETCDDGEGSGMHFDCDGCHSDCRVENACGDGFICGGEACDDGNDDNEDTCDNNCTVPACGNAILNGDEECDDGNLMDGDGCNSNCTEVRCGNGIIDIGEVCDDGNQDTCEGTCSADCQLTLILTGCGDGWECGDEVCDDGNEDDTDACTNACEVAECGDGVVEEGVEECDDGNDDNADTCTDVCELAECGDGVVQANGADGIEGNADDEQCDSGNTSSNGLGDPPCDSNCTFSSCGNGVIGLTPVREGCDDANNIDTDECTNHCFEARCGDGVVQEGVEECDDGNHDNGDLCNSDCEAQTCSMIQPPCSLGNYGCYGTIPTTDQSCTDANGDTLFCSCPNPSDRSPTGEGFGQWLPANADCADACWSDAVPSPSVDAGMSAGSGAAGMDVAGSGAAGSAAAGSGAAGTDAAGTGAAGMDAAGSGAAGMDAAGSGAAGTDAAGAGGSSGSGAAGTDAAGSGAAGTDAAGSGAAGMDAGTGGTGGTSGGDGFWHFTLNSDEVVTGSAEVRIKNAPSFAAVHTFTAFPTSFTRVSFTPGDSATTSFLLVVQWPVPVLGNWLCEGAALQGTASAVSPTGVDYVGVPVSNDDGGCDIGFVPAP